VSSTMPSQPAPFSWQQVDQTLASLMLADVSREFQLLGREDLQHIHYQNMGNGNGLAGPSERVEMHRLRTDEIAARRYAVFCDVWRRQQKPLSPEFLRAICPNGLQVLVSARINGISSEFALEYGRTGRPDQQWLKAAMEELKRAMIRLYADWEKLAEIDAKSLEHLIATATNHPDLDSVATQVVNARSQMRIAETRQASIEAQITTCERAVSATLLRQPSDDYRTNLLEQRLEALKANKKQFEGRRDEWHRNLDVALRRSAELRAQNISAPSAHVQDVVLIPWKEETPAQKVTIHPPDVPAVLKLKYKSPMKRAIAWALSIDPEASDLRICRRFDEDGFVALPKSWTTGDNRSFERAYKDPKHRRKVENLFSRVRTDMRKKGLLS
jgi:hypothetical protein